LPAAELPRSFANLVPEDHAASLDAASMPVATDAQDQATELGSLRAELDRAKARIQELEIARADRELEILRFSSLLSGLPLPSELRHELGLVADAPPEPEVVPEPAQPDPALLRAGEIKTALRTLLTMEGLYTLDLLEVGELHDPVPASSAPGEDGEAIETPAEPGWVGPVLFRLLDPFGRLNGSLHAERLHLEGSRASRTLQVVLANGYESHQGERVPFEGGLRRITLPLVDPERWIDRVPELFSPTELDPVNDDGLWDLGALRLELNVLLGEGSQAGWFRFHGFGGVLGDELMDVHLQEFDTKGRMRRRLFADRLRIQVDADGVTLLLTGGASGDADGMHPFRDGRHQIFLPAAKPAEWRGHHLPGVRSPREATGDAHPAEDRAAPTETNRQR